MKELEEYKMYIQQIYNELMEKTENRNISYGEIVYIQDLSKDKLQELEAEILEELEQ